MKKIIFLILISQLLICCKVLTTSHDYYNENLEERPDKIEIDAVLFATDKKFSEEERPVTDIYIKNNRNSKIKEIIPQKAKIIADGKEYYINPDFSQKYEDDNNIRYYPYKEGIILNSDTFIFEVGKLILENGEIIELPPVKFVRGVKVEKINYIMDMAGQNDSSKNIGYMSIFRYREWRKKNPQTLFLFD